MAHKFFKSMVIAIFLSAFIFPANNPLQASGLQMVLAKEKQKNEKAASSENTALPENLNSADVDGVIASLSDQQVRRLLIEELKKQAASEAQPSVKSQMGGLAGFIDDIKNKIDLIKEKIEFLKSGASGVDENLPTIFSYLGEGKRNANLTLAIVSVIIVFLGGFLIEWLFGRYTAGMRTKIKDTPPANWRANGGTLLLRLGIDLSHMLVFAVAVLAIFYLFSDRNMAQRVLVSTYLASILIVRAVYLTTRFILAPGVPHLRFLPLKNETAVFLQRWVVAIATVASFGLLTCGIIRLAGGSEASHFIGVKMVGIVIVVMLISMILAKRKAVVETLTADLPSEGLRYRLARNWHHFAIFVVLLIWIGSVIMDLLDASEMQGLRTLMIIALYFLLDWILRQILAAAFGLAEKPESLQLAVHASVSEPSVSEDPTVRSGVQADSDADEEDEADEEEAPPAAAAKAGPLNIERMRQVIQNGLRIALAALTFLWIMRVWGLQLPVGRAVASATFEILIVVFICYLIWAVSSAYIQQRLQKEMPETDEDMEEGGAGGSRVATLLVLLRKFMLVVLIVMAALIILSTIGVNIGPLIAGAGVIGLAIGFGAQTLVKDIISGVFFLVDDAFRVGDYVETAGSKGMVEAISIRSLRLRHPRGMVYTVPFSDMGIVTNYSRDYIITKLDFRVRYDADVEKIRKIIKKKVYKKILKDETLGPKLLGKIKSQGVREMDDSAMIMRVKYKTQPGEQFAIRKEVYRLMQEAFRKEGIEFAHRNVTVYIPPESKLTAAAADAEARRKMVEAGAAAAVSAQAEAEAAMGKPGGNK